MSRGLRDDYIEKNPFTHILNPGEGQMKLIQNNEMKMESIMSQTHSVKNNSPFRQILISCELVCRATGVRAQRVGHGCQRAWDPGGMVCF